MVKTLGNTGNYKFVQSVNSPTCVIFNSRTGEVMHYGSYKHCREMWNTRYNYRSARYNG